jgi:hypothetical protein
MPLILPSLDDSNFEQLLTETKRRIQVHTPEWTNFELESDPGITLVELFAFLTDSLIYRANRIPERNRLKFLQLLGVPLQPPAAADGLVAILNERGPLAPLPLNPGVVMVAGNVEFISLDPVNVLPVEAQVYYKRFIDENDSDYEDHARRYNAILAAQAAAVEADLLANGEGATATTVRPAFYETTRMTLPTPGDPNVELNLVGETSDRALYIALLAPNGIAPADARVALAGQTLSIGIVPALAGDIPPLRPMQSANRRAPVPNVIYEIADAQGSPPVARWRRLPLRRQPDVLTAPGIVQVELPDASALQNWEFAEPLDEGTGDFPPKLEDDNIATRLVTWVRLRLPLPTETSNATGNDSAPPDRDARFTWVGINTTRVLQAVPVANELVGLGNGEPDQAFALANRPVIKSSISLVIEDDAGRGRPWRLTDDLLAADANAEVFTLDPEAGVLQFGDGLRGVRPPANRRIFAAYHYGGGIQGNVGIGAIKNSRDLRLQGGFKIENPLPTSGGSLGESVAEGERNIPLVLRHQNRLVTHQDFHDITWRTPGVDMGRVEVLPLFIPTDPPQEDAAGVVTLMVIPRHDLANPLWPTPDRLFLRRVCDHLDGHRLITTEIYVRGPKYLPVYLSVGVRVQSGFFADVVRQTVTDRLRGYLSSLKPGGPTAQGWPLLKPLIRRDLEAVVTRVRGVEFVESMEMGVTSPQDTESYYPSGLELPFVAGISVREGLAEPIATIFAPTPGGQPSAVQFIPVPVVRTKC